MNYFQMVGIKKCSHGETQFLGTQKSEKGMNKYYRCSKCGKILVLSSNNGFLYEIA